MVKRLSACVMFTILAGIGVVAGPTALAAQADGRSLLVKLVSGLAPEQQTEALQRCGGTEISSIPALRLHTVAVPAESFDAALACYQSDPEVVRVEANQLRQAEAIPTDELYPVINGISGQWHLPRIGWDRVFGNVVPFGTATVAVLDTGVDATHPDLADMVLEGSSVFDDSLGLVDANGHGTGLAGIVAAATDNGIGIAGVAYQGVRLLPVTVLGADGTGQDSDVIAGVIWAADNGADVILMAFSNPGSSESLQEAIDYAWAKGAVLVAATGNAGSAEVTFPAGHRGVMGVSATDQADALAAGSNYGQAVFLAAPGVEIRTTGVSGSYATVSGTSSSAAVVAGVAGFMKAADPTLTNGVIVGRLARTADPAGTPEQTGNGRVNMERAVADTSIEEIQPAGAPGGGPFVGPYVAAVSGSISPASGPAGTQVTINFCCLPPNQFQYVIYLWRYNYDAGGNIIGSSTYSIWYEYADGQGAISFIGTIPYWSDMYSYPMPTETLYTISVGSQDPSSWQYFYLTAPVNNQPQAPVTVTAPSSGTYGQTGLSASASGGSGTGAYAYSAGSSSACSVDAGSGAITVFSGTGSCAITATRAGDSTYAPSAESAPADVPIYKATATVNVSGYSGTYDAAAHGASGTATGVGGADLSGSLSLGASFTDAPGGTANWSFDGGTNYASTSGSVPITIGQATSAVTVTCPAAEQPYTGAAIEPCTASVAGVGGLSQALTVSYADNVEIGTATASASYGGDTNHMGSGNSATFEIGKAGSTVTVTCPAATQTYTGAPIEPCTAAVTGVAGLNQELPVSYLNNTNVGTATASASFAGDAHHFASTGSDTFAIGKANSTVRVTCPVAPQTYSGTAFDVCTASVSGVGGLSAALPVSYLNNTNVGTATANASYAGDANHKAGSGSMRFEIIKAAATVRVTCPVVSQTYTGAAFKVCTASVSGAGGLSQALAVSYANNTNVGTATASASYAGDANHDNGSGSANFKIGYATVAVTVTVPTGASFTYTGIAHPAVVSVKGAGGLSLAPAPTYSCGHAPKDVTDSGCAASYFYPGDLNHSSGSGSITYRIAKATSTTTVTVPGGATFIHNGSPHPATVLVTGAGGLRLTPAPVYSCGHVPINVSDSGCRASYTYPGDANHTGSSGSKTYLIR